MCRTSHEVIINIREWMIYCLNKLGSVAHSRLKKEFKTVYETQLLAFSSQDNLEKQYLIPKVK